jgi:hypothetical protein
VKCVLCARRNRTRELETGHVCPQCRNGLRVDLGQILDLVTIAATMPDPFASRASSGGGRPHLASRPPLEVARIDPELILVRLDLADTSSTVPLLAMLESWERAVREDRGFAPYGIASSLRAPLSAYQGRGGQYGPPTLLEAVIALSVPPLPAPRATLASTLAFLVSQVDWMTTEPTFGIEEFAGQVHRAIGALRALDPSREHHDGWGIPCLADVDTGLLDDEMVNPTIVEACGRRLTIERHDDGRLDLHSDIHCPDCGTVWTAQRLLLVALADDRVTVWGYPEAITAALGIPRTTLLRWAERGVIGRLGNRYDAGAAFRQRHAQVEA